MRNLFYFSFHLDSLALIRRTLDQNLLVLNLQSKDCQIRPYSKNVLQFFKEEKKSLFSNILGSKMSIQSILWVF